MANIRCVELSYSQDEKLMGRGTWMCGLVDWIAIIFQTNAALGRTICKTMSLYITKVYSLGNFTLILES